MIRGAVLGANVSKSRSPAIHAAAFRALRVAGKYGSFSVEPAGFEQLCRQLGEEGYRYLNVTIPHKATAAALAGQRSPLVRRVGAANTLLLRRGPRGLSIRAENTDGYGLLAALGDLGVKPGRRQRFVMVGSGGAAAGGLAALVEAGASVTLLARRPAVARALRARFAPGVRARIRVGGFTAASLKAALAGAAALISAVPADAWASAEARAGLQGLPRTAAVLEMAYGGETPLGREARTRVARYQDGLPMLVHQAARAVELVTGRLPPAAPLLRAARIG
jgi:shikimate dehydrogenase